MTDQKRQLLRQWNTANASLLDHPRVHPVCAFAGQRWGCPDWRRLNEAVGFIEDQMISLRMPHPSSITDDDLDGTLPESVADGGQPQQAVPDSGIVAGDRVRLFVSDCPDPVTATVTAVYLDAGGQETADLDFGWKRSDGSSTGRQYTRLLRKI